MVSDAQKWCNSSFPNTCIIKDALSSLRKVLATQKSCKNYKKCFLFLYIFSFIIKSLLVLKIYKFCLEFLVMSKSGLIRKARLISKFMTSQPFEQTIAIHILTKISRCKGNQAIFGQLIEYNMRNIFFQKLYTICNRRYYSQIPFKKSWNWAHLWINSLKFDTVCFYCMLSYWK